ncbi:MAG: hypothetical protein STSR0009_31240 [Methanoregula sp.]
MAEGNFPLFSSVLPEAVPETIPDEVPDMDVMEWERIHIEIPEMQAQHGLQLKESNPVGERQKKKGLPEHGSHQKKAREPVTLKKRQVAQLFASLEKLVPPTQKKHPCTVNRIKKNVVHIDRSTGKQCTDYHLKKEKKMPEDRVRGSAFAYLEGEISRLRLLVEDLQYRLGSIEAERRSR